MKNPFISIVIIRALRCRMINFSLKGFILFFSKQLANIIFFASPIALSINCGQQLNHTLNINLLVTSHNTPFRGLRIKLTTTTAKKPFLKREVNMMPINLLNTLCCCSIHSYYCCFFFADQQEQRRKTHTHTHPRDNILDYDDFCGPLDFTLPRGAWKKIARRRQILVNERFSIYTLLLAHK